jgi:catechol 2,3-dioxygenase-like lactoylglutathione lyase family enzyme
MRPLTVIVSGVALVLVCGPAQSLNGAENTAALAGARLNHVAVATRDVDATAKTFADVLGVDVPPSRSVTLDGPAGQKVQLKIAFLNTANFQIELDQPIGPGPTQQFLEKYGVGIQHIGFTVQEPLETRVRALEQRGGRLTVGTPGGRFAFVDLTPLIGTTIELVQQVPPSGQASPPAAQASARAAGALASRQLSHVGFVVRDAKSTVDALASLLGIPAPALNVFKPIDYLPGSGANPDAHVRFVQLPAGGVNIEVIEPVGEPSPWAEHVAAHHGNAPHHIAFSFAANDSLDDQVRALKGKGGVWKKGKRGFEGEKSGSSPEFEFFDTLGMVIEVSGGLAR